MKLSLLITFLFLAFSCSSDSNTTETDLQEINMSSYFPFKVGNNWLHVAETRSDYFFLERLVVDTFKDIDNDIIYKVKIGNKDLPEGEYGYIFYLWNEEGLWEGGCDSCNDDSVNTYSLYPKNLILKSGIEINETWENNSIKYQFVEILDQKEFNYNGTDLVFTNVVVIKNLNSDNILYYAKDIGFIGNEDGYILIDYSIK